MRPWGAQWLHGGKISDGATHGAGKMDARGPPRCEGTPPEEKTRSWVSLLVPHDVAICHGQVPSKRSQRSEGSYCCQCRQSSQRRDATFRLGVALSAATGPVTISGPVR